MHDVQPMLHASQVLSAFRYSAAVQTATHALSASSILGVSHTVQVPVASPLQVLQPVAQSLHTLSEARY